MKLPRRRFLHFAAGVAALLPASRFGWAQAYPMKPITMIVPFAAGGATDVIARIVAGRMRISLGQPVIIENVTGANGSIGVGRAVRAAPDGYTIVIGSWTTHVVNGAVYTLQYDVLNDFEPIALLASNPEMIVAKSGMPANNLRDLISWLKANPDKASQGTAGIGSTPHLGGVLFQRETGTRFQFVPYRGGGPATQDLLAGQIDIGIDDPTNYLPLVRADRIRAYAVTARSRLAAAPDIPTVDEAGLPGFYFSRWHGLWAPKQTPKSVLSRLSVAVTDALAEPSVGSRLAELGQEVFPRDQQTPEALAALQKAEIEKWWPIIKAANIRAE
jgi:tripartite-type tricarboxylate transporter receptor subunit TctC